MPISPRAMVSGGTRARVAGAGRCYYRRLGVEELPLLNDLHNAYYRKNRPLAEAVWLFAKNPHGSAITYGAFSERGELIGIRPSIPFRLCWRGRERIAYEFADALVHPRYQRRGIFSDLLSSACDLAQNQHYVLFSLPNAYSLAAYRHNPSLQVLGGSCTVAKPLRWKNYAAQQLKLRSPVPEPAPALEVPCSSALSDGNVLLRPVDRLDSDFSAVERELRDRGLSFALRSQAFLDWRYCGSPVRKYRLALVEEHAVVRGYLVIRMMSGVAQIVDFFLQPDAALARRAFSLAAQWARQMGASGIHFVSVGHPFFRNAARQAGYWLTKRSRCFVVDRAAARSASLADLHFVMGDFDFM